MTIEDEDYLFDLVEQTAKETHENNLMLKQIIRVLNTYISHHHQENEEDFGRNVLANLISGYLDLSHLK